MTLTEQRLFDAIDATWPPARLIKKGPWCLRDGRGGGKRVSAATALRAVEGSDIARAEDDMRAMGQDALFMVRGEDTALDAMLVKRGYRVVDPVTVLAAPVAALASTPLPRLAAFTIWEPLAIMREIWAAGGIGPARVDVMARAATKTAILARNQDRSAGVAFAAVSDGIAMVHAVEVLPAHRRQGVAGHIMTQAALWAQAKGAETLTVLCTDANKPALALYSALGFAPVGQYHYRMKDKTGETPHG